MSQRVLLALAGCFALFANQQARVQAIDYEVEEWGCIECGNSTGLQFFPRHRVSVFPCFEEGVGARVGSMSGGTLKDVTLERKDAKGRVRDRIQGKKATVWFDWHRSEVVIVLQDGSLCVDGWIKRSFNSYEVRMPLFSADSGK